jgi:hypothetical protein
MHVRDAVAFLRSLLARCERLDCERVFLATPSEATTHVELFEAATSAQFGQRARPILLPGAMCRFGLLVREMLGYSFGMHAFERPWMGRMIDKQLRADSSATQAMLGWSPRPRLGVVRRMPFLIENRKSHPAEWLRRNHGAIRDTRRSAQLEVGTFLAAGREKVVAALVDYVADPARAERFPHLRRLPPGGFQADATVMIDRLLAAVRTRDKAAFALHCREFALRRFNEGIPPTEWAAALDVLSDLCVLSLSERDTEPAWHRDVYDHVTMTMQFGIDAILEAFEDEEAQARS